jgi:hypothetical protein
MQLPFWIQNNSDKVCNVDLLRSNHCRYTIISLQFTRIDLGIGNTDLELGLHVLFRTDGSAPQRIYSVASVFSNFTCCFLCYSND